MRSTKSVNQKGLAGRLKLPTEFQFGKVLKFGLVLCLLFSLAAPSPVDAKRKRRKSRRVSTAGSGGGVILKTPNPRNPLEHNNRGVELGSKGLWADAIREHEAALNGDPYREDFRKNLSSAHLRYGDILARKKDWYNAMNHFREALYADPNNMPAATALSHCIRALGKNPDDYNVRESMAGDAEANGNYPIAVVEYRICVRMRDNGMSRYNLGKALYKQGKVAKGYEQLREAVVKPWEKSEKNTLCLAHSLMGDILWKNAIHAKKHGSPELYKRRLYNASICYRRAVTANPLNTSAAQGLLTTTREAVAFNDSFDNNLMMAGAYQLISDFDHAKMYYAKCWRINSRDPRLHKARLSYHLAVVSSPNSSPSQKQNSVMKIQAMLEKRPDDPFLLYIYGRGKEELKDKDTALLAFKKAYLINPFVHPDLSTAIERITGDNPSEQPLDTKAGDASVGGTGGKAGAKAKAKPKPKIDPQVVESIENKITEGDLKGAEADLMALVEKDPKIGKVWLMLGNVHEQQGELTQAKVAYRTAKVLKEPGAAAAFKQINSSRIKPMVDKAKEQMSNKQYVKAAATLRQAARIAPKLPTPHRMLSEVLALLGDKEESKKELTKANELEKSK